MPMPWDAEDWARLGQHLRRSREAQGFSRREMSEASGVSEKSIQLTEEGRVPTRWPKSIDAIESALGWETGSVRRVLDGQDPVVLSSEQEPVMDVLGGPGESADTSSYQNVAYPATPREIELTQAGHLAQYAFVRQMKRYRNLQNVTVEELAKRVADAGGSIEPKDLARLENGMRLLNMSEAGVIARALDTTVDWLLGSGFRSDDVPEEMQAPPTDEELQVEAKAVERRMAQLATEVRNAQQQYLSARQQQEAAQENARHALAVLRQNSAQKDNLERQYQYLLGRIDSLRAAKGEQLILPVHPIYDEE